ncbi:hypothetical protein GWR56_13505 [Mucilaginibacter sp. 14171R-50]|uniref:hypothetical protein n=1 Tax=Mucilaginibacter sp. 14171R-50 TaxID=2703789 RepID=UPI00138D28B7|nr:hypothetical protein [Mucilaginibacter sp. 14171R-50]QHS56504.1 hypothetical protein GWR56_13505 [Mucilaginibacter sp. 14171R-50]
MLKSLTQINACTGISIRFTGNGTRISALSVSRNGSRLDLGTALKDQPDLETVMAALPAGAVVSLNFTGKGILHKAADAPLAGGNDLFMQLMPGAGPGDFHVQQFGSASKTFLSLGRKGDIDPFIDRLSNAGFRVVMLSFGPFPVKGVLEQLNQYGEEFSFDGHEITFSETKDWTGYRYREGSASRFAIKLGVDQIDEQLLLPYAAAFQVILYDQVEPAEAKVARISEQMDSLRQAGALKRNSAIVLIAAFVLLFANTLLFTHLNSENGRLMDALSLHSTQASDVTALADKTAKTEELVKSIGYSKAPEKAVMIDEAAALMPAEISLSAVELNPLTARHSDNPSAALFAGNVLIISGTCNSILPVNEWLARIRSLKWVTRAELRDYGLANDTANGGFTIIINF